MLVLTRRPDEETVIDGPCVVRVVEVRRNKVRLGFIAPGTTIVKRAELDSLTFQANRVPSIVERSGKIQADESDIADLGQRVFDPLGVGPAYEELELK